MVRLNPRYIAELVGPGRTAFIATNGLQDSVVIDGEQEDEYRRKIREGWRVVEIRPICRSLNPKLIHSHPDLQKARAYSYSLVVLEHPARLAADAREKVERKPAVPEGKAGANDGNRREA